MIIFGMISALKIFTLTLMTILALGAITSFDFAAASEERPDAYPEWGADVYTSTDTAVARVVDPFMNVDPNKVETLTASIVVADNYDNGIKITLTETGINTGIFEEIISFTKTEEGQWAIW